MPLLLLLDYLLLELLLGCTTIDCLASMASLLYFYFLTMKTGKYCIWSTLVCKLLLDPVPLFLFFYDSASCLLNLLSLASLAYSNLEALW